jgi:hypothetical protein
MPNRTNEPAIFISIVGNLLQNLRRETPAGNASSRRVKEPCYDMPRLRSDEGSVRNSGSLQGLDARCPYLFVNWAHFNDRHEANDRGGDRDPVEHEPDIRLTIAAALSSKASRFDRR